jgi:hypothetical protein
MAVQRMDMVSSSNLNYVTGYIVLATACLT